MNILHLLRMSKWARHPPSARRVKLVIAVILLCVLLFAIERYLGRPDWISPDLAKHRHFKP
ncbi:MAG: hypothetical protein CSA68_09435 [Rhodobacterales bacterium]|nr:MAG: hypothetical protein CSA68_09435 [Rhodobacterales bacterium]